MPHLFQLTALAAALTLGSLSAAPAASTAAWPAITREAKPWTRWWWPGNAVDKPNLTRELEAIAAAGFGGVEITPLYGAKGYEDRYLTFLSPKYLEMLAHVGAEAKRLGLGVDMATGTGWPFGGPQVTPADAELKLAFDSAGKIAPVPTRFKVKRSAPGGEGWVLNPYSTVALTHYLALFSRALDALPAGTIHSQFHDSFEYEANWANEVPEKFKQLHGYDLRDHATELNGIGDPDTVARIKSDYRTTLAALHLDYIRTWVAWAHAHGQTARNQAHGAPGNLLDLYAAADIPETEIFGSIPFPIPGFRREAAEIGNPGHPPIIHRFASSAAHVMGKPYASSETFTWLREHFHESPSEMKPELDALFLAGINHVFYHGTAYSPADAPWPGWLFYASSQVNPRNPLWRDLGDGLNAYVARCQSLLQSGQPDNDLLVYWPADDLWHNPEGQQIQLSVHASWLESSELGKVSSQLTANGYQHDYVSDEQLQLTRVENGELKISGRSYRALVVPRTYHMPLETLRKLHALASEGFSVRFVEALPRDVPGFGKLQERRSQFQATLASLRWEDTHSFSNEFCQRAVIGRGAFLILPSLRALINELPVSQEPAAQLGLGVLRRQTDEGYLYFFSNLSAKPVDDLVELSQPAPEGGAILLNPLNGAASGIFAHMQRHLHGFVHLQLQPGESIFLKTFNQPRPSSQHKPWLYQSPGSPLVPLTTDWHVTALTGGPELPSTFTTHELKSWTAQGGEWERFAGTARYEIDFELPATAKADDWLLDLGDVRETARVFVNGKEADLLWSLPFRTRIGAFLKPGRNTLALEITNLAANRIRDLDRRKVPWKNFHEINFVNIFYKPFDAADWPLQPSGLLGPVTLTPLRSFTP